MFKIVGEVRTIPHQPRYGRRRTGSSQSIIYINVQNETVMENLEKRRERPYTTYRKEVIPEVLKALGMPADTKVSWSQYAGCSCPCSPGFKVDGYYGRNFYVDVKEE